MQAPGHLARPSLQLRGGHPEHLLLTHGRLWPKGCVASPRWQNLSSEGGCNLTPSGSWESKRQHQPPAPGLPSVPCCSDSQPQSQRQQRTCSSGCGAPAAAEARPSLRSPHPGARARNSLGREVLLPGPGRLSDPAGFCADLGQESGESLRMAASSPREEMEAPGRGSDSPSAGEDLSQAGPGPGLPGPRPGCLLSCN